MSTWIRRATGAPSALGGVLGKRPDAGRNVAGAWHLDATSPAGGDDVLTACGLSWATNSPDRVERTEDLGHIREAVRCATCDALYVRRITRA